MGQFESGVVAKWVAQRNPRVRRDGGLFPHTRDTDTVSGTPSEFYIVFTFRQYGGYNSNIH